MKKNLEQRKSRTIIKGDLFIWPNTSETSGGEKNIKLKIRKNSFEMPHLYICPKAYKMLNSKLQQI